MKWPVKKLGEFIDIVMGQAPNSEFCNKDGKGTIFVKAGEFGIESPTIREWTTQPLKIAKDGDSLICVVGATAGKINRSRFECAIGRSVASVRVNSNELDQDFLHCFLKTKVNELRGRSQGAAQAVITREMLQNLNISLPSITEQKCIAKQLETADRLLRLRESAIEKIDDLAKSIFVEMFGDVVANTKQWELKKLVEVTAKIGSGATPRGGDAEYKSHGISLIRSLNVHDGEFKIKNLAYIDDEQADKLSNVVVSKDDVLLNITGASVARVCRVPISVLPARVNQHVMIIRPNKTLNPVYLERLLLSSEMKSKLLSVGSAGATREAITKASAENLLIPVPPLDRQIEFTEKFKMLDKIKGDMLICMERTYQMASSLQHHSFNVN